MSEISEKEKNVVNAVNDITAIASAEIEKINDLWTDGVGTGICNCMVESVNKAINYCGLDNFTMRDIGYLEELVLKSKRDISDNG